MALLCDMTTYDNTKPDNIFELGNPEYYRNKKRIISLARLQAEIGTACLMTSWRHFVTLFPSCKYDDNNQVDFSHQYKDITETKMKSALKHICKLRWRQFVSWRHAVILVTPWRHVMTWRHHACTYTMKFGTHQPKYLLKYMCIDKLI